MKLYLLLFLIPFLLPDSTKIDSVKIDSTINKEKYYKVELMKESKEVKRNNAKLDSLIKVFKKMKK